MNDIDEAEAGKAAEAEERMHVDNLLASVSGRWLLRQLVEEWKTEEKLEPTGNSWDMYRHGRRKALAKYREMLIRHRGDALLELLKG